VAPNTLTKTCTGATSSKFGKSDEGFFRRSIVSSSRYHKGHRKVEMMIQLSKLTDIKMSVVVAPPVVQQVKCAV
jgi:hypothetical protein